MGAGSGSQGTKEGRQEGGGAALARTTSSGGGQARLVDSLGRTMGPYGVFETPRERRARYISLWVASLNLFVDAVMFPILIPTVLSPNPASPP